MSSSTSFGSGTFGSGSLGSSPFFSVSEIIDGVLSGTGHSSPSSETGKRTAILQYVNNAYQRICLGQHWRWLIASYDFNLEAPYTTGTVSCTNGDATVTGVGTLFNANIQAKDKFWLSGSSQVYHVSSLTSNTVLELETDFSESSVSDSAYTIAQAQYKLPKETDHLLSVVIDVGGKRRKLAPVGLQEFRDISSRSPTYTGTPEIFTLDRRDTDDDFVYVNFFPIPDQMYNLHIDYTVRILKLSDSTSCYPIIPDRYRAVLYYAALSEFLNHYIRDPEQAKIADDNFKGMWLQMMNDKQQTDSVPRFDASRNYRKRGGRRLRISYTEEEFGKLD